MSRFEKRKIDTVPVLEKRSELNCNPLVPISTSLEEVPPSQQQVNNNCISCIFNCIQIKLEVLCTYYHMMTIA